MRTEVSVRRTIPSSHPSLPGHFPGNPIVPGVVILSEIIDALREIRDAETRVAEFPAVKFSAPLKPDTPFEIFLLSDDDLRFKFRVEAAGVSIAAGQLQLVEAPHE